MKKLISWNVNGLRAAWGKGFPEYLKAANPDVICLQETKLSYGQFDEKLIEGYHTYWNYAEKKGYSGTAIFTKEEPMAVTYGIDNDDFDNEGRVITAEYPSYYLITCYTPNSKRELERLDYRVKWEEAFRDYVMRMEEMKPVILCGDLNVAHEDIDLKHPSANHKHAGFTDEERQCFSQLLDCGYEDSFRHFYPDKTDAYTWWSYMSHAREKNVGWRIDYFLVSVALVNKMVDAKIDADVMGSDHCPVELDINV